MSTIHRRSRRKLEDIDPIKRAWDAGDPPPREAYDPARHEEVIEAIFFRWAEVTTPTYCGPAHPRMSEWLDALRASRP